MKLFFLHMIFFLTTATLYAKEEVDCPNDSIKIPVLIQGVTSVYRVLKPNHQMVTIFCVTKGDVSEEMIGRSRKISIGSCVSEVIGTGAGSSLDVSGKGEGFLCYKKIE